jgi:hypothetical protein
MDRSRSYWPRFLFHITSVSNAASVLASGRLLSRSEALRLGVMQSDNASRAVIEQTDPTVHQLVRFYFRPRTPTFYNNEGIRGPGEFVRDSHCGVPIALIFDAAPLLCTPGSQIADGNRANRVGFQARIGNGIDFLRTMPFELIYEDAWMPDDSRPERIFRRHAEVGIPDSLDLTHLAFVVARTPAELTTLKSLVEERQSGAIAAYETKMRASTRQTLFFKRWTFIDRVTSTESEIAIAFNPSTRSPGPFQCRIDLLSSSGEPAAAPLVLDAFTADGLLRIDWSGVARSFRGMLRVELDGHLAFFGPVSRETSTLVTPRR